MLAHFDNSAKIRENPNSPPKEMRWGEQRTDEMCIGFLQLTRDDEQLKNQPPARFVRPSRFEARAHEPIERLRKAARLPRISWIRRVGWQLRT